MLDGPSRQLLGHVATVPQVGEGLVRRLDLVPVLREAISVVGNPVRRGTYEEVEVDIQDSHAAEATSASTKQIAPGALAHHETRTVLGQRSPERAWGLRGRCVKTERSCSTNGVDLLRAFRR